MTAAAKPPEPPANPLDGVDDDALLARLAKLPPDKLKALVEAAPGPAGPAGPAGTPGADAKGPEGLSLTDQIELGLRRREEQRAITRGVVSGVPASTEPPKPPTWRERIWKS